MLLRGLSRQRYGNRLEIQPHCSMERVHRGDLRDDPNQLDIPIGIQSLFRPLANPLLGCHSRSRRKQTGRSEGWRRELRTCCDWILEYAALATVAMATRCSPVHQVPGEARRSQTSRNASTRSARIGSGDVVKSNTIGRLASEDVGRRTSCCATRARHRRQPHGLSQLAGRQSWPCPTPGQSGMIEQHPCARGVRHRGRFGHGAR